MSRSDCFSEMFAHMYDFWKKGMFIDFHFVVGESVIGAHKAVLAASSPVFRAMFESEMEEARTQQAHLEDVDAAVFTAFLEYLYVRKEVEDNVGELLMLADKYDVESLLVACDSYMRNTLSSWNVVRYLQLSELYRRDDLKQSLMDYVQDSGSLVNLVEWNEMKSNNPQLTSEVIHNSIVKTPVQGRHADIAVFGFAHVSSKFGDALITLKPSGLEFRVHAFVLTEKSPILREMFEANPRGFDLECGQHNFFSLMNYIYFDIHPSRMNTRLIRLSKRFQLDGLTDHCILLNRRPKMTPETVVHALIRVHRKEKRKSLKAAAIEYIVANLSAVSQTYEWKDLFDHPDLLAEIHFNIPTWGGSVNVPPEQQRPAPKPDRSCMRLPLRVQFRPPIIILPSEPSE